MVNAGVDRGLIQPTTKMGRPRDVFSVLAKALPTSFID